MCLLCFAEPDLQKKIGETTRHTYALEFTLR